MDTIYTVQVIKDGEVKAVIDYPKDFPLPVMGDGMTIEDKGNEYKGTVIGRQFTLKGYREIMVIMDVCKNETKEEENEK